MKDNVKNVTMNIKIWQFLNKIKIENNFKTISDALEYVLKNNVVYEE